MVASLKMDAFWDIAPCSLIEVYQHFRGAYCIHHQGNALYPRRQSCSKSVRFGHGMWIVINEDSFRYMEMSQDDRLEDKE
jgi:hypothetical protein